MLPSYEIAMSNVNLPYEKLNKIKAERNKKLNRAMAIFLISTVILVATFLSMEFSFLTLLVIGIWIFSIWYPIRIFIKERSVYKGELKQVVIGAMADNMLKLAMLPFQSERYEKYCRYKHDARISDEWIEASELFEIEDRQITGEDYFEGKYGLTEFYMSELKITKKEYSTDADGLTSSSDVVQFKGVLFVADLKQDFTGVTVIETKYLKMNSAIGGFFAKKLQNAASTTSKRANQIIGFENDEFTSHFTVRTDNESEARFIINPTLMRHLLDFCKICPYPIMISFHQSYMFVAAWSNKNFIDSNIKQKYGEYDLRNVYDELAVFFQIIEVFEINTKVSIKE